MSQTLVREQSAVEMQPMLWLSFARKGGVCLCSFCARNSSGQSSGFLIQERGLALIFAGLRAVADSRCFSQSSFASHYAELRGFAAKIFQTVENNRE